MQNIYIFRSLVELFKILKLHSPVSVYNLFKFCPKTHHLKLMCPKYSLDISKNNFTVNSITLWNSNVRFLFDKSILCIPKCTNGLQLIIPGNVINSDLTMSVGTFKSRLRNLLIKLQKEGDPNEWS